MKNLRILIADDHEAIREGVRAIIERQPGWKVCGTASTGREAVKKAQKLRPDVVVLDVGMPELNGLEAAHQIKRRESKTEVLVFSGDVTDDLIRKLFRVGVKSYINKSETGSDLIEAIQALSEHKRFFTKRVSRVLFAPFSNRQRKAGKDKATEGLTSREREIVQLVAEGKTNKEVARVLGVSARTVETHRASALHKLEIDSLADLVRYAIRNRIIEG